ncbi:hypothetical protein MOQ72_38800 [Saccharopolyspora sp. K220]|nr:hypothetical protein [Saccharopolyspora soli]MCI2423385.1 hypothetical protein [Saccharopolyspora soli]
MAGAFRAIHDEVDTEPQRTVDLLHHVIEAVAKHARMVGAEARTTG